MRRGRFAVGATVAVIVAVSLGVIATTHHPQPAYVSHFDNALTDIPKPVAAIAPARLSLPAKPTVLFFGDSWVQGYGADKPKDGWAYVAGRQLGTYTIDGIGGTGFLIDGPKHQGTYLQRMLRLQIPYAPQLVVVQGGINDSRIAYAPIGAAVTDLVDTIHYRWPDAQVLLMGPPVPNLPVSDVLRGTDQLMQQAALANHVAYISELQEGWTTTANLKQYIDLRIFHPNTAGHAYFAQRFLTDLAALNG